MIQVGEILNGKYKLVRLLGDGGMGSVYEGQHEVLGTRVAIKVLHPELSRKTGLVERFLQEATVAARIKSPHVVQVMDVDRTALGHAFIVMELLEGEPLSAVLDRHRTLPVPTACDYAGQILEALEAAHALGVIHRDLKPENVFVTFAGGRPVVKLIDFGIAKLRRDDGSKNLTIAGVLMGTAEYMAPEQARSASEVDARADLYAVGVMLYEMISGARPVLGEDARIVALKVERGEVIPLVAAAPDVPREVAGLVHRAMAARPDLRFTTATEMRLALGAALAKRPSPLGPGETARLQPQAPPAQDPETAGTGTLRGAAVDAVLAAAASREASLSMGQGALTTPNAPPPYADVKPTTMRAPPPDVGHGPSAYGAPMITPSPGYGEPPRRKKRGGFPIWLLILPVVAGVGIAVAFAMSSSSPKAEPQAQSTRSAGSKPGPSGTPATNTPTPTDTIAPLDPLSTRGGTTTTAGPGPGPRTSPSGLPSAARGVDAGGAAAAGGGGGGAGGGGGTSDVPFPTLTIPTAFPTAFPTLTIPTAFPTSLQFPGQPSPTSAPPPTAAPTTAAPPPTAAPTSAPTNTGAPTALPTAVPTALPTTIPGH